MQYFQAVKIGKERANKAQMIMFEAAGFGMLTLTTKKIDGKFMPVGEQNFTAVIQTSEGFVTIIVDEEGYTKAQSKNLEKQEAMEIFEKLRKSGIPEFQGESVNIWTESYSTVQKKID